MVDGGWWLPLLNPDDTLLRLAKTVQEQSFIRQATLSRVFLA
jgi:hypothetical protein